MTGQKTNGKPTISLETLVDSLERRVHFLEDSSLEKTQKDFEKPSPHKWEHGDVFSLGETTMICIRDISASTKPFRVFCLTGTGCSCTHIPEDFLKRAKFLFNIKEKL